MSNGSKARDRQRGTGERYMVALYHVLGDCHRCQSGKQCPGCLVEPCWTCLPQCDNHEGKCQFDDVVPDGKACAYCGRVWPRKG